MADRIIREVTIGGVPVVVKELKVREIRAWLADKANLGDVVDVQLFEDLSLSDLSVLTDLSSDTVEELAPSQIRELIAVVREVNPDFFAMRGRLAEIGRQILANDSPT